MWQEYTSTPVLGTRRPTKRVAYLTIHDHMQTHLQSTIGHYLMARGDTLRLAQFGHMFTTEHEEVGPDKCVSLDIISVRGKTVNAGEKTYHTLVRTQR